jgi:hypothetical protein
MLNNLPRSIQIPGQHRSHSEKALYSSYMDHWHGFGPTLKILQIYESTIVDNESDLSAHFITVPARSLGGDSYLFQGPGNPLYELGLLRLADVPLGGVVRSLAACLVSEGVEDFMRRFDEGFNEELEQPSIRPKPQFGFAEYLTFARVVPFEWSAFSFDSLGNILTAQGHGEAGYMYYEDSNTPVLVVAIPAGILICGPTPKLVRALEAGLRTRILELVKARSGGEQRGAEGR